MRSLIALAGLGLALTACGGGSSNSPADAPAASQPPAATTSASQTVDASGDATSADAARAVAQEEADRYSAEDYGGAWELWTKAGQDALSKSDYEKLHAECPGPGVSYDVENVRIDSPGNAVARLEVMGFKMAYPLKYEGGEWRWQPLDSDMKDYALGVDKLVAKKKAEGSC